MRIFLTIIVFLVVMNPSYAIDLSHKKKKCRESFIELITPRKKISYISTEEKNKLAQDQIQEVLDHASSHHYQDEAIYALSLELDKLDRNLSVENLKNYVTYVETYRKVDKRLEAIRDIAQLASLVPESKYVQKYLKSRASIQRKVKRQRERAILDLKKNHPDISETKLKEIADRYSHNFARKYSEVYYGCRSPRKNAINMNAGKAFRNFSVGIELATGLSAYHYYNQDKDWNFAFYGQLGFEIFTGYIGTLISTRILANPSQSWMIKGMQKYTFTRIYSLAQIPLFTLLFTDHKENNQMIEDFMKNPNNVEEAKELKKYLENPRYYEKFKHYLMEMLNKFEGKLGLDILDSELKVEDVDWDNLTKADLENEEIQDLIVAALLSRAYDEEIAQYVKDQSLHGQDFYLSGDIGMDRYNFHSFYGAVMLPRDTAVNWFIYHTLCMNQLHPKVAIAKAVAIFALNRGVMDNVYHWSKRQAINQPVD